MLNSSIFTFYFRMALHQVFPKTLRLVVEISPPVLWKSSSEKRSHPYANSTVVTLLPPQQLRSSYCITNDSACSAVVDIGNRACTPFAVSLTCEWRGTYYVRLLQQAGQWWAILWVFQTRCYGGGRLWLLPALPSHWFQWTKLKTQMLR